MQDITGLSLLFAEYFLWNKNIYQKFARIYISKPDRGLFIAEHEGELVGFAMLRFASNRNECTIENLYVMPSYTRNGIGSALLEACERLATERGISVLALNVYKDNAKALNLYKTRGFALAFGAAARPIQVEPPPEHLRMQKYIPKSRYGTPSL